MNTLITTLKRAPKRTAAVLAMVAAAIVVPAALYAWGPDRPTYTIEKPAPHVTFNSITNNPAHGDERNFVQIKEAGAPASTWSEQVALTPGKEYEVYVYYHNNASTNLNSEANGFKGIARNTTMRVQMPASVNAGEKARFTGFVKASNATPGEVWDEAYGTSANAVALRYVQGSATIHSRGAVDGAKLPDSLFTTGAKLGYSALDGNLPGCNEYAGYVTYKFKVDQPNFEVKKTVSNAGQNAFSKSVTSKPTGEVEYKIEYKNTGTTQQNNVVIKDQLPKGVSFVPKSTKLATSVSGGKWVDVADGVTNASGINIGSYAPGGNAFVKFTAKVAENKDLPACGVNTLVNKATAATSSGSKEDTANVIVTKDCTPPKPQPELSCDNLTVTKIERTKFKFDTKYTVKNATFKHVTYVVRDAANKEVYRGTNANYTQTTIGKYTVQAIVTATVDGSDKTVTSDACKKAFEVVKAKTPAVAITKHVDSVKKKEVAVNQEFAYQLVVTNSGEVDLTDVKVTDAAPANVQFISADKGTIANNKWSYTIPSLKIGASQSFTIKAKVTKEVTGAIVNTACVDAPQVPGTPDDCDTATVTVPPTPVEPPVTPPTTPPTTPTPPSELPQTGAAGNLLALLGLGSLIASAGYYIASRRALLG